MAGWRATREAMRADRARLRAYHGRIPGARPEKLYLHPGYAAIWLHRIAHYLYANRWRRAAQGVRFLNLVATGADFDPACAIGGGMVIPNPQTVTVHATIGVNCSLMAQTSLGWPAAHPGADRNRAQGRTVLADDVELGPGALVLGPVRIGHRVRIGARCLVTEDVPDDTEILPLEWRMTRL